MSSSNGASSSIVLAQPAANLEYVGDGLTAQQQSVLSLLARSQSVTPAAESAGMASSITYDTIPACARRSSFCSRCPTMTGPDGDEQSIQRLRRLVAGFGAVLGQETM